MNPVTLILHYKRNNTYAFNVLVGALESAASCEQVEVVFAGSAQSLAEAARSSRAAGRATAVLWSFYSPQVFEVFRELAAVKEAIADAGVLHVAGGTHATAEPEHTLRGGFDLCAVGEGEHTLIALAEALQRGEDPRALRGLAYLNAAGAFVSNGPGERADLDAFPPCAPKHHRYNALEITRGCIYACKFCQTPFMFKAKFRHRSVENIAHHVEMMRQDRCFDVRFITPTCLSYGSPDESPNLPKVEELLAAVRGILREDGRLFFGTFPSELRPEHVTPEALRMLKRYVDNDNVIVGGQSGSDRILKESGRGHGVREIEDAVRICLEEGFLPNVDFIFGLPGEEPVDVEASLALADRLSARGACVHAHAFMPLPGTPWKNAKPGVLTDETIRRIEALASSAKVYGQWKQQMQVARELAAIPRPSRTKRV